MWRQDGQGVRAYHVGEIDLFALVALDSNQIAYVLPDDFGASVCFRAHDDSSPQSDNGRGRGGNVFSDYGFARALGRSLPLTS